MKLDDELKAARSFLDGLKKGDRFAQLVAHLMKKGWSRAAARHRAREWGLVE